MGAGTAIESIATILELQNGVVHPTINFMGQDPELPKWNFCIYGPEECEMDYALCNAFGFGGHNASILYKKI